MLTNEERIGKLAFDAEGSITRFLTRVASVDKIGNWLSDTHTYE